MKSKTGGILPEGVGPVQMFVALRPGTQEALDKMWRPMGYTSRNEMCRDVLEHLVEQWEAKQARQEARRLAKAAT